MEAIKYQKGTGEFENWLIEESFFDPSCLGKCEAIFCQGNGYMGLRAALEESYVGETRDMLVTGTFNRFAENEVTELPNLPDITQVNIVIDGKRFSLETGEILEYSRVMNLKTGELKRNVIWRSPSGKKVELSFSRIVSLEREHIIASKIELMSDKDSEIKIESGINGRVTNNGSQHCLEGERRLYDQKCLEMVGRTNQSAVIYAVHAIHKISMEGKEWEAASLPVIDRRYISKKFSGKIKAGETLVFEKVSSVHTSRDMSFIDVKQDQVVEKLKKTGRESCQEAALLGYDILAHENAVAWKNFWDKSDIRIDSVNSFDQLAIRFAEYHLNIMMKKDDNRVGIGAKGLTGEGYKGHSFWDTEIFLFPYYLFTDPSAARTLLEYRYKNLYGARIKAKEYGVEGAMYPWESAWIDDGEVTPLWGAADVVTGETLPILTGMIEIHISADIAYAVDLYYRATSDEDFMNRYGYEILLDTARFWLSRMSWKEERKRYEILDVIGPDEYKEHINNNAYTNYMAANNIKLAKEALSKIKAEHSEVYIRLKDMLNLDKLEKDFEKADKLYLPEPDKNGIIPQFDGYFDLESIDLTKYKTSSVVGTIYNDYNMDQINGFQVAKQGDTVVLMELMESAFPCETRRRNFEYYEAHTLHDSSLSKSTHCVLAADLKMDKMAYDFFEGAAAVDLGTEMKSSDMGVHTASMGGIWQCVVYGFGGVRLNGNQLRIAPNLPVEWKSMDFHICFNGANIRIEVKSDRVIISTDKNISNVVVYEKEVTLEVDKIYEAAKNNS